jgi:hypothetical protein
VSKTSLSSCINLLKPAGYFTYHQVKHSKILTGDYIAFMCFVWLSEQAVTFALYVINRLVFITELESVYCAVRTESLYNTDTSRPSRVKWTVDTVKQSTHTGSFFSCLTEHDAYHVESLHSPGQENDKRNAGIPSCINQSVCRFTYGTFSSNGKLTPWLAYAGLEGRRRCCPNAFSILALEGVGTSSSNSLTKWMGP